jgi:signal transduction histidine kinase
MLAQMMAAAGLTLLVGAAFSWTRERVQRWVDRLFYGGWYDYPGVVETVSDALSRSIERRQVVEVLTHQVPVLMQMSSARLWIGSLDDTPPVVSGSPDLRFIFHLQEQRRGVWTVSQHSNGEDFTESDRRILATLAHQAEIALNNVLLVEALRRQIEEIRASRAALALTQRQLLRSREEERARLARDLHDSPIQALVGMNLQLGLLLTPTSSKGKSEGESALRQALQDMRSQVRSLLSELRQMCTDLRPPTLDTLGLGAALRILADDWSGQTGVTVHLDLPADVSLRPLPDEAAVNLYRVAQEALANVARHAAARQVTLRLAWQGDCLALSIRDDGRGFALPKALRNLVEQGHFGLVGMQERVELIGGQLSIESTPGRGATILVTWQPTR